MRVEYLYPMQPCIRRYNRVTRATDWAGMFLLAFFLVFFLSGCALGPDYSAPKIDTPTEWTDVDSAYFDLAPTVDPLWWKKAFQDPELDQLIAEALSQNLTLRSAGLRVLQAQQLLAIAIGYQYPQQQEVSGSASRQEQNDRTFNNYSLGFNIGWELDIWGRFSRQVASSSADLDASVAGYDGVVVSLLGQVAQTYILIRTYQEQLDVIRENIRLQEESLRIARAKADVGAVSELDVNQGESLLYSTRASLAKLEIPLQQAKNALAVLLGKPPQAINHLLVDKGNIPAVREKIALGMPQDLIRRRPDLRAAESLLASQCYQIGVSITELYPHLTIGGSIGTSAGSTNELFRAGSETWSIAGAFSWNIFNYGRLTSNVRLQDALFQQLLVDYYESVLQAQSEVENSIVAHSKYQEQLVAYDLAEKAAQSAVDISTAQYQEGLIPYDTVINTLIAHLNQQNQLTTVRGDVSTSLVQVFKSLGGGWEIREDRDPVDLLPVEMKEEMRTRTRQWEGVLQ